MGQLYNIYCDESCHIINNDSNTMAIGAIWCPDNKKAEIFEKLKELKEKHGLSRHFEIKWNKVSNHKVSFYLDVINYFFDNSDLYFRVVVIPDKNELTHSEYNQTHDDFYYKTYFNLLKTIFEPNSEYNIFLDIKDTQGGKKLENLHKILCNNSYDYNKKIVKKVQQVRSHEVELIALSDLLIGAITYLWRGLDSNKGKLELINLIKNRSRYSLTSSTLYKELKFNIFVWKSGYGRK